MLQHTGARSGGQVSSVCPSIALKIGSIHVAHQNQALLSRDADAVQRISHFSELSCLLAYASTSEL